MMTMNSISTAMELFSYTGVSISLLTIEQTLVLTVVKLSRIKSAMIVNTAISIKPKVEAISITLSAGVCISVVHFHFL